LIIRKTSKRVIRFPFSLRSFLARSLFLGFSFVMLCQSGAPLSSSGRLDIGVAISTGWHIR